MSTQKRLQPVTSFRSKTAAWRSYADAEALAAWMNQKESGLCRHQGKVRRAIIVMRQINSLGPWPASVPWPERMRELAEEVHELISPLKHLRWRIVPSKGRWFLDQTYSGDTNYGLLLVARLSQHGLDWVRQCSCGKWFVGYTSRQRFCSAKCKKAFEAALRKTPEEREKRRQYMRNYRENPMRKRRRIRR